MNSYEFYEKAETITLDGITPDTSLDDLATAIATNIPEDAIKIIVNTYGLESEKSDLHKKMLKYAGDKLAFDAINYMKIEPINVIGDILLQNIPKEDLERWHYVNSITKIGTNLKYVETILLDKLSSTIQQKLAIYTIINQQPKVEY